ncbi:MAG: UDP-N-acetylmuramyl-tripeptide synthetase [Patescibacteria group bacterium]|mgnify:CR=1 FL=1
MGHLKNLPLVKFFYQLEPLRLFYHFCLSFLATLFYRFPSRKIFVIGVTGTKGKTTVVDLVNLILETAGKKTAVLSSLYFKIGENREENLTENTMPGRFFVQNFLDRAVRAGCSYAVVEVTSEGVRYSRHRFINWNIALITNLAPEHIESHGSFEKYREAKLNFLKYAAAKGAKIFLNNNDRGFNFFYNQLEREKVFPYSVADRLVESFLTLSLSQSIDKSTNLLFKKFNLSNVAAAIAITKHIGIGEAEIVMALKSFNSLPGRMDVVLWDPFRFIVDYAHTPESLEKFYQTVRGGMQGEEKLICVLGSAGGGRDKWKRSAMGEIAAGYCESIILTNEDPYDENPKKILNDIRVGIGEGVSVLEILDRREAILKAVDLADTGDSVVITGKGSEPYIHVSDGRKIAWSDRGVAEEVLEMKKLRK